jgi:hypothetical protein
MLATVRDLAPQLARIPGVVAVTLGGSRATGSAEPDSDWDFGLYYERPIDRRDIEALGWPGEVFGVGEWGRIVNGGAWLTVDGQKVDLIYRDLAEVRHWTDEADEGRFEVHREVGYVAGIATYVLAGELALGEVLVGDLPRPTFSDALSERASSFWFHIGEGALRFAAVHGRRGDATACLANLTQALLCTGQGVLARRREWVLNEKRLVARAGLAAAAAPLASSLVADAGLPDLVDAVAAELQAARAAA